MSNLLNLGWIKAVCWVRSKVTHPLWVKGYGTAQEILFKRASRSSRHIDQCSLSRTTHRSILTPIRLGSSPSLWLHEGHRLAAFLKRSCRLGSLAMSAGCLITHVCTRWPDTMWSVWPILRLYDWQLVHNLAPADRHGTSLTVNYPVFETPAIRCCDQSQRSLESRDLSQVMGPH